MEGVDCAERAILSKKLLREKFQQIIEDDISKLTQVSTLKQHSGENECVDATIGILEYTKNMKELPKEYTTLLKEIRKDSPISSWLPSFSQKDTRHKFNFRVSLFSPGMLGAANFSAGRGKDENLRGGVKTLYPLIFKRYFCAEDSHNLYTKSN